MQQGPQFAQMLVIAGISLLLACGGGGGGGGEKPAPPSPAPAGLTAQVSEEILFNAEDVVDLRSLADPMHTKYAWSFGDDTVTGGSGNPPYPPYEGRSATHVYKTSGSYTLTLTVTPGHLVDAKGPETWDDVWDFPASGARTCLVPITVTGESWKLPPLVSAKPIFELSFEGDILDSSANHRTVSWANGAAGQFVQGLVGKAVDL